MADTTASSFVDAERPFGNQEEILGRKPTRLAGSLAPASVAALTTVQEKVRVKGASRIRVRAKLTGTALDADLNIKPLLADETTEAATGTGQEATPVTATEFMVDLELKGEKYVNIEVVNAHAANALTINYVDVYLF